MRSQEQHRTDPRLVADLVGIKIELERQNITADQAAQLSTAARERFASRQARRAHVPA